MDGLKIQPRTTGGLLEWLRGLGLPVTATQLENDCRDGFLPGPPTEAVAGGRGRSAVWEPWMVRRAERLYRLRKRKDAAGKPLVYGDTLRLLLFVRDGWGWNESIKDLCLRAIDKSIAATVAPVRRYVRGPLDHEKVEFAAAAHEIALTPGERYAVGVLVSGTPLEGASLERVFHATNLIGLSTPIDDRFIKFLNPLGIYDTAGLASKLFGQGFSASVIRAMFSNLTDDDARPGALRFTGFMLPLRRFVHRAAMAEGTKKQSTNPLSMFGQTQRELEKSFREGGAPKRITPAQMLAAFVGIQILSDVLFRYVDHIATLAVETAKKVGLKAPDDEQKLLPFAMRLMELTFGTQAIRSVIAAPPK